MSSFFNILKWTEDAQHLKGLTPLEVCTYINEVISYYLHMLKLLKITDYLQNRNTILNSYPVHHCLLMLMFSSRSELSIIACFLVKNQRLFLFFYYHLVFYVHL